MDIRKIKKLIELLHDTDVAEIEISEGEESVRITRGSTNQVVVQSPQNNWSSTSAPSGLAPSPSSTIARSEEVSAFKPLVSVSPIRSSTLSTKTTGELPPP